MNDQKPGFFRPKPKRMYDTQWSFFYDPPLDQSGRWWRFKYSRGWQNVEHTILAFAIIALAAAAGIALT